MTRTLTLKNRFQGNTTTVENDFIDNYISKANGEYVKVYLMLLRHLGAGSSLSICGLADCLECTEKDILRAFKYWAKVGLLKIDYDEAGNICGLSVGKTDAVSEPAASAVVSKPAKPSELRQLYFVAEQYIGKPLSSAEIKKINYFYDSLQFSIDLIEYLIEYCVENGHRTFRYIESVALAWADAGIQTVEAAKMNTSTYSKHSFAILNAFGIKGRGPAPAEVAYIKKWTGEYGFTVDIIVEACNRTINNTHKPDFKYTDSILTSWLGGGVHHLADIAALDRAYQEGKAAKKRGTDKPAANNRFNNFEGHDYDMESIKKQLFNIN